MTDEVRPDSTRSNPTHDQTMKKLTYFTPFIAFAVTCLGADLPTFQNDVAADAWLRQNLPRFKQSCENLEKRGGYEYQSVAAVSFPGFRFNNAGKLCIDVPVDLKGTARVIRLLQNRSNAGHAARYKLLDGEVTAGKLPDPEEYVGRCMAIYWEAMGDFGSYLADLEKIVGAIPQDALQFPCVSPKVLGEVTPEQYLKMHPEIAEFLRARYLKLKSPQ